MPFRVADAIAGWQADVMLSAATEIMLPRVETRAKFDRIDRLDEICIGASVEPGDEITESAREVSLMNWGGAWPPRSRPFRHTSMQ